ncbi:unnamed protein product, partial [Penicillium salamii]
VSSGRPSYVNALLIASRGFRFARRCTHSRTGHPFGPYTVRLPGFWEGACMNCKWKDHQNRCDFRDPNEAQFLPSTQVHMPSASRVEELTDSDGANDGVVDGAGAGGVGGADADGAGAGAADAAGGGDGDGGDV